jgi:hypothetical protein
LASRYITSFKDLPDGPYDRSIYRAWNEGDIAHTLDNKAEDTNPYDPETQGILWRTWRRGWEGRSMAVGVQPPPALPFRIGLPIQLIKVKYRPLRKIKFRLRALLKRIFHVPRRHHLPKGHEERQ